MNRKRDRSPSASPNESTKLCLIFSAIVENDENPDDDKSCVYAIIFDPKADAADTITTDDDGFILNSQPTVRFDDLDHRVAFCVSKSTVYIIESNKSPRNEISYPEMPSELGGFRLIEERARLAVTTKIPVKKAVYSFDLDYSSSSTSSSNMVVVQKSELRRLPDMLGGKVMANAVATPHGKILVFCSLLIDSSEMVEFEVFDPVTRVWSKLPPLEYDKYAEGSVRVWGNGFLSRCVFLVSTTVGNYAIDLEEEENERCWKKQEQLPSRVNDSYFIEEGVCLSDYSLRRAGDWDTLSEFPEISRFPEYIRKGAYLYGSGLFTGITNLAALMWNQDGSFAFCCIQAVHHIGGFEGRPPCSIPFFILDVFHGNRHNNNFITSKETTLKFSPRNLGNLALFMVLGFFST